MKIINRVVMTIAGLFLIVAGLLKASQIMSEPIISDGFWESWLFFVIQIPLEIGLGVWLVSGLFRKAAWLLGTLAFFAFIFVTSWKWYTGAESCGCFGQIHVDPRITLFTVDIPIFLAMAIFRPKGEKLLPPPWPHPLHCLIIAVPTCFFLGALVPVLWYNKVEPVTPDDMDQFVITAPLDNSTPKNTAQTPPAPDQNPDQPAKTPDSGDPQTAVKSDQLDQNQQQGGSDQHQTGDSDKAESDQSADTGPAEQPDKVQQGDDADQNGPQEQTDGQKDQNVVDQPDQSDKIDQSAQQVTDPAENADQDQQQNIDASASDQTPDESAQQNVSEEQPAQRKVWGTFKYIDKAEKLAQGMSIMFFYHYDCPDCQQFVPSYSEKSEEMGLIGQGINFAFVALPPYKEEEAPVPDDTKWLRTRLNQPEKGKWLIGSPWVVITLDGQKIKEWKYTEWQNGNGPTFEQVIEAAFSGQTDLPTDDQPEDQKDDVEKYLDQTPNKQPTQPN